MPDLKIRFLSKQDIELLRLSDEEILEVVEDGLRAHGQDRVVLPAKSNLSLEERYGGHFNILSGYVEPLDTAGVKVIGDYAANYRHGLPSEIALLTLYHAETGVPFAILDATLLTWMRTGAVTAIGAKYLARRDSHVLAHIGARGSAWYNIKFLNSMFDLGEIRVTSKRPESRERFAKQLASELGRPIEVTESPERCVAGADIIVDASRLSEPQVLIRTDTIQTGALVVPYGAVMSTEKDLPLVADKFVIDDWNQAANGRWGQYTELTRAGVLTRDHVYAEVGEIVSGAKPGREAANELIVFWHRGFAISDIMLGSLIFRRALTADVGTVLLHYADVSAV